MKNKLIIIGIKGNYRCYLNIPREEAIRRYIYSEDSNEEDFLINYLHTLKEIEFDDVFGAYSIFTLD